MEANKVNRLNELFEKVVSERATKEECSELKVLYNQFIEHGREDHKIPRIVPDSPQPMVRMHY